LSKGKAGVGNPGNRGGGTYKKVVAQDFYSKLDVILPKLIDRVVGIMDFAEKKSREKFESRDWKKLELDAAKVLISKAPDRVANPDGSSIFQSILAEVNRKTPPDAKV